MQRLLFTGEIIIYLEALIGVVDAQLLKAVHIKKFETKNV